jgi:hypothetical protein
MAGHPDPDTLAGFRAGLLGRRRTARIRTHLAGCAHCTALDADLAEVTKLLASAPPPRMPDHLVTRLENVLAAEAAARAQSAGTTDRPASTASQGAGAAGTPGDDNRRWPGQRRPARGSSRPWQLRPAALGTVAAVALVLALGGYGLASLHRGAAGSSAAISGPAHESAGRPFGSKGNANGNSSGSSAQTGQQRVIKSGTDYLPGRLAQQAQAVLASHPVTQAGPLLTPAAHSAPQDAQSCVTSITHGQLPLLLDEARYRGQPATIIIAPATAAKPGQVWVVTGSICSATNRNVIAHAPLTTTG